MSRLDDHIAARRSAVARWTVGDRSPETLAALAVPFDRCPECAESLRARAAWEGKPVPTAAVAEAATAAGQNPWTAGRIVRLRPLLAQCPYADGPLRGCGCRACWWRSGRDVALRDCLECTAQLVPEVTDSSLPIA